MTELAKKIMSCMDKGITCPVDILALNIGESESEVAFIMEQIKIARGC